MQWFQVRSGNDLQTSGRRARAKREAITYLANHAPRLPIGRKCRVTFTRVARIALDDDNLVTGLKLLRDGVSRLLGFPNDRDLHLGGSIAWERAQARPADPTRGGDHYALIIRFDWITPRQSTHAE